MTGNNLETQSERFVDRQLGRSGSLIAVVLAAVVGLAGLGGFFFGRNYETQQIEAGRQAIAAGNWENAVESLTNAVELSPGFLKQNLAEALAMRGFAQYQLENNEAALSDFDSVGSVEGQYVDLSAFQADIAYQQGSFDEVLVHADAALEHEDALPTYLQAQVHGQRALALWETGNESGSSTEADIALSQSEYLSDEMVSELLTIQALNAFAEGNHEAGLADVAQIEALSDSVSGRLLGAKSAALFEMADLEGALSASEMALDVSGIANDDLANLHVLRANIAYLQGDLDSAVAEAESAAALIDGLALPHALQAWQQYRTFDWIKAVESANEAIELDDESALAYRVRGAVELWEGRYDNALSDLSRALELDPDDVEALAFRTALHIEMSNDEGARADASHASEVDAQSPATLFAQAAIAYNNYDVEQAYVLLTQAISIDDTRPEYFAWRANTYEYRFQDAEQTADLEAALELHPEFRRAVSLQLWTQINRFDFSNFEETTQFLLERYPDWDISYRTASDYASVREGDVEQALVYAEQAIELNPSSHHNYINRGYFFMEQGEMEKAKADFDRALEISPDSISAFMSLADYATEKEDFEGALAYHEQAHALFPYPEQKVAIVLDHMFLGNSEQAWKNVHEVLAVDPDYASAMLLRSLLAIEAGDSTQALNDLTILINQYPGYAYAHLVRAELRLNEGDLDAATNDAGLALELDPNLDGAHYILSLAALYGDDLDTAVEYVDSFVTTGDKDGFKYGLQADLYRDQGRIADALISIEAGLALEDLQQEQLLLDRAHLYLDTQDVEGARSELESLLTVSADLEILNQAENSIAYIDSLADLVDGRLLHEDVNFTLTYSPDWTVDEEIQEPFKLLLVQNTSPWGTIFLVGIFEDVSDFTAQSLSDAIGASLENNPGYTELSVDPIEISGQNGLVRFYQLESQNEDGEDVTVLGRQYYFVQGDQAFLLSMETAAEEHGRISPEWDLIVDSFELAP